MHRIGSCDVDLYIQIGIVVKNMSLEVEYWCEACSIWNTWCTHMHPHGALEKASSMWVMWMSDRIHF